MSSPLFDLILLTLLRRLLSIMLLIIKWEFNTVFKITALSDAEGNLLEETNGFIARFRQSYLFVLSVRDRRTWWHRLGKGDDDDWNTSR